MFLEAVLVALGPVARGHEQNRPGDAVALARRESADYVKAFNDRKTKELVAPLIPDADLALLQGSSFEGLEAGQIRGGEEIAGCHALFFSVYPRSRLSLTVIRARLLRPDLLIADVDFDIQGLPSDAGPIRGRSVIIRVREAGAWKIAAERNVSRTPRTK
jgi:hypothetical protein